MKKIVLPLVILVSMLLACTISTSPTAAPGGVTVVVPTTVPPVVPTDTPTGPAANVTCNELSFYLAPAVAASYDCQTIPEATGSDLPYWGVNPQYTQVNLTGYAVPGGFSIAQINVLPVARYTEIAGDLVSPQVTRLQSLIAGGPVGSDSLPFIPLFNAAQIFHARYQVTSFASGSGIRFMTMYGQDVGPINSAATFYTFQGLTADGKYWVSVILPITNSMLPADGSVLPGGETWDEFSANYTTYLAETTSSLNAQPDSTFAPTFAVLDGLVKSITIAP